MKFGGVYIIVFVCRLLTATCNIQNFAQLVIYGNWIQSKKWTRRNKRTKKSIIVTCPFSHFCGRPVSVAIFSVFSLQNKLEDWIFSVRVISVRPTSEYRTALWFISILQASAVCKWSLTYTS